MRLLTGGLLSLLLCPAIGRADIFRVTNTRSTGLGSLRRAILDANANPGGDRIRFTAAMKGCVILLSTPLPAITDAGTIVDGDIDNDGLPDVAINGRRLSSGNGLKVLANDCTIEGLAITNCPWAAISLEEAMGCRVRGCHLGLNLAGTAGATSYKDINISGGGQHTIGQAGRGNYISGGTWPTGYGVDLSSSDGNVIQHNVFGLDRSGFVPLGEGGSGVTIGGPPGDSSLSNRVCNNVFGGLYYGVGITRGNDNVIAGNTFGLAVDGQSAVPIVGDCIRLSSGGTSNLIGGTMAGTRNVFAGGHWGIEIGDADTRDNRVVGNWFGSNATGNGQRPLDTGIVLELSAGPQTIGGPTEAHGNYFAPKSSTDTRSITLGMAGAGTLIRNNRFGSLPGLANPTTTYTHLSAYGPGSGATVRDNRFNRATFGITAGGGVAADRLQIHANRFSRCQFAVEVSGLATVVLGNLHNPSAADDGGNQFDASCDWYIRNERTANLGAEGNEFPSTVRAEIDAGIWDRRDDPSLGRVDFDPLLGGVHPTGNVASVAAIFGAAAAPTRAGGAEIVYTLSAPARVTLTVHNLAGRPVATVARDLPADPGLQRTLWSGRSDQGTRLPAGCYLVRIAARTDTGGESRALAGLQLPSRR